MTPELKNIITTRALQAYINFKAAMTDAPLRKQQRMAHAVWCWLKVAGIDVPHPTGEPLAWFSANEKLWWGMVPNGRMELFASVCTHLLAKFSSVRLREYINESKLDEYNRELAGQLIYEAVYHKTLTQAEADLMMASFDKIQTVDTNPVSKPKLSTPVLTRSQRAVVTRCAALAELFFSKKHNNSVLHPRVYPLIAGPTGAGKSKLAKVLAEQVEAKHVLISFARWMPQGVGKEYEPTQFTLLRQALLHKRLIVQIDEMDKFGEAAGTGSGSSSPWSKSVLQEVFAVLDGEWPIEAFRRHARLDDDEPSPLTDSIFFMASGTWQAVHANPPKSLGFGSANNRTMVDSLSDRIRAAQTIPVELMARFHNDLLLLNYPARDEIPDLLEAYGLNDLAARLGETIDPNTIEFAQCGMRIFEGIASDLLLKIKERENERKCYV